MMPASTPVTSTTEQQLKAAADRIRHLSRKTSVAVIEIGRLLVDAKELTPHGSFAKWVQNTCGFTLRTAQSYMRVATLAAGKSETISLLPLRALYLLSAKQTPETVVTWVFREIGAGRVPTERAIEAALRSARALVRIDVPAEEGTAAESARALARELIERVGPSFAKTLLKGQWDRIGEQLDQQLRLASGDLKHHDRPPVRLAHDLKSNVYRPAERAPDGPLDEFGAGDHPLTDSPRLAPQKPPTVSTDLADRPAPAGPQSEDGIPAFLRRAPNATHH